MGMADIPDFVFSMADIPYIFCMYVCVWAGGGGVGGGGSR